MLMRQRVPLQSEDGEKFAVSRLGLIYAEVSDGLEVLRREVRSVSMFDIRVQPFLSLDLRQGEWARPDQLKH